MPWKRLAIWLTEIMDVFVEICESQRPWRRRWRSCDGLMRWRKLGGGVKSCAIDGGSCLRQAEDRAFEEEAYKAYEGLVHEEAFEAPDDNNEEDEHVDVPDIQEEDVDGFPGGPRDTSLLTHYVQHVAYGISQGRSPRQSSTLAEIRSQLDGLAYSEVVWHQYEGHRGIRPFFDICMYSGWIRIDDTLSRHFPERVMRQFGLYQEIPRPPTTVADANVIVVDYAWLHFMNHVIMNVRQISYPSECVNGYIQWFMRVSHPYIIPAPPRETGSCVYTTSRCSIGGTTPS
ncbi:hypothetical protein LR48_Vigan07g092900 [Vigna angularis]|uniref:Aminotransferase-like plant mobile domain-containing protein n=1 Tax=Phaseolus angularis TaxID=3914 RepID=A0A0L9UWI9_PHAAN|nr:hypothetical protein LR48_Vigan07g092900 [Vigna angularis]